VENEGDNAVGVVEKLVEEESDDDVVNEEKEDERP